MSRVRLVILFFGFLWTVSVVRETDADIFAHRDSQGVLTFTNIPRHSGYRRVIRTWSKRPSRASQAPPSSRRFQKVVRQASDHYGVDPNLVWAVMKVESDFNPRAVSRKGARGLMQLMPETARQHNVRDVYDPKENISGGVRHLRSLLDRFQGNLRLALAGYNAGAGAVEQYKNVPPFPETRKYVRRVLDYYQSYRENGEISIKRQAKR